MFATDTVSEFLAVFIDPAAGVTTGKSKAMPAKGKDKSWSTNKGWETGTASTTDDAVTDSGGSGAMTNADEV